MCHEDAMYRGFSRERGKRARRAMISRDDFLHVTCTPSALAAFSRRTTSPCSLTRLSNVSLDVSSAIASSTARDISEPRFRAFRSPAYYFIATGNESRGSWRERFPKSPPTRLPIAAYFTRERLDRGLDPTRLAKRVNSVN